MNLDEFLRGLAFEAGSPLLAIDEVRAMFAGDVAAAAAAAERAPTSVGIVPLIGSLGPRAHAEFAHRIDAAAANPDVGHIVLPVDSPGGTVSGTPESAAAVARAQAIKPVTAHVLSLGASAAYWAISPAGKINLNPSAQVGSIGVIGMHMDVSKALEAAGLTPTLVRSAQFKGEGNAFEPLSEEARAHLQSEVDESHAEFVRTVAAGRKVSMAKVNSDFGQGRVMSAHKAVAAGMADHIGSLAETLSGARRKMDSYRRRSAALL